MEQDSELPASPGAPLFPISSERVNQQRLPQGLDQPRSSLNSTDTGLRHSRTGSDVQLKVAQFNSISREAETHRSANDVAMKRAVLGREEAENENKKAKEELRRLRKEIEEGKLRERRVGERVESLIVGHNLGSLERKLIVHFAGG